MNELSNDLNVITAQINLLEEDLDRTMNERAFQIGKLLNHVKEDIQYGGFTEWLENNFNFSRRYGYNFMSYYNQHKDVKSTAQLPNFSKEVEIMSLPPSLKEEIRTQVHTVPSTGEAKHYNDLSNKELREVKQQLKTAQSTARHWESVAKTAQNQPPKVITNTVEVVPVKTQAELADLQFKLKVATKGYQDASEKLKSYETQDTGGFDEEQARLMREKLQHEAEMNTIQLRIVYKTFIEKSAISTFMQGAIANATVAERQRLTELVEIAEKIMQETKLALKGRRLGVVNE